MIGSIIIMICAVEMLMSYKAQASAKTAVAINILSVIASVVLAICGIYEPFTAAINLLINAILAVLGILFFGKNEKSCLPTWLLFSYMIWGTICIGTRLFA